MFQYVLVTVCHRHTQSTKVYVDREGETSAFKKWNVGGLVVLGSIKNRIKKFKTNLYDVE